MKADVVALLAGLLALRIMRFRAHWPWRVIDIQLPREDPETGVGAQETTQFKATPLRRPASSAKETGSGRRRFSNRHQRQVTAALPSAADLLSIAASAGHSVHGAVAAAAEFGQGPVCEALTRAHLNYRRGARLVDELSSLPEQLGPTSRSFASTLVMSLSSGAPVGPALQRLADAERRRSRRQIEERVRRLPVLLLAPLIGLILPAFVILAIVPVVVATAELDLVSMSPQPHFTAPHHVDADAQIGEAQ